ncbi:Crp/Fnr family transcriptional regulator [Methylobacterium komagatae]|uniref:Crp/Fnr family transcriptional regulator n=1 Tax=Methylobacterium komagatae TaxID=374425 RepID=A0ABW2BQ68_9HYPH
MHDPLAAKLARYVPLSVADRMWLSEALGPARSIAARTDIIDEGEDPHAVNVILEGWACRSRQLVDGRRQIVSLLLPGDPCDPHVFLLDQMDHAISALTPVVYAQIPGPVLQELTARSAALDRAFQREALATAAIQREWTVSLGCRSGIERLAHLFCELPTRLSAIGLATRTSCPLPLTQHDLAHSLGQTSVHINRTLQELRAQGLITLRSRRLTIHDPARLAELAHFDASYLHFTVGSDPPPVEA